MDVAVLVGAGLGLIALGLWGIRRRRTRSRTAGIGFVAGGALALLVALMLAAGVISA